MIPDIQKRTLLFVGFYVYNVCILRSLQRMLNCGKNELIELSMNTKAFFGISYNVVYYNSYMYNIVPEYQHTCMQSAKTSRETITCIIDLSY